MREPAALPASPGADRLAALAAAGTCLALYLATLAPGVTAEDSGLLTLAAAHAIPAHPPGYTLYTLLGWLWLRPALWLDLDPARWLAALSALLAAAAVYHLARDLRWDAPGPGARAASWLTGVALGAAAGVWSQSVIVEVYPLGLLELALALRVFRAAWADGAGDVGRQARALAALALLAGLGLFSHHAVVAIVGVLGLALLLRCPRVLGHRALWPRAIAALGPALLLALATAWRAAAVPDLAPQPVRDHGELWSLLSRAAYRTPGAPTTTPDAALDALVLALDESYGPVLVAVALLGLGRTLRERAARGAALWELAAMALYAALVFAGNPFTDTLANRQINAVLLYPLCAPLATWLGAALGRARLRPALAIPLALALAAALIARSAPRAAADDDTLALRYIEAVADCAPPHAVLVCSNDQLAFPLTYAQALQGWRPDLRLVETSHPRHLVPGLPAGTDLGNPTAATLAHLQQAFAGRPLLLAQVFYQAPPGYRLVWRGVLVEVQPAAAPPPSPGPLPPTAIRFLDRALRPDVDPDRVWHVSRGWFALAAFASWLAQVPGPVPPALLHHARTQLQTQPGLVGYFVPRLLARDPAAARTLVEALRALQPGQRELELYLALIDLAQGRRADARTRLQALLEARPDEPRARELLAELDAPPPAPSSSAADAGPLPGADAAVADR